nr:ethylene-responsive transcription factor ERF036-like [Lolium perenne]
MVRSSRCRSPPTICNHGGQHRRTGAPTDLPPPPHSCRHNVWQREWGTWVAEITDRNTGRRIWLGTFQSAAQALWRHDIENASLHGSKCGELNYPLDIAEPVPELVVPPHRGRAAQLGREDRDAWNASRPSVPARKAAAYAMCEGRHHDKGGGGARGGNNDDGINFSTFDD